jgi:hypothetical protein
MIWGIRRSIKTTGCSAEIINHQGKGYSITLPASSSAPKQPPEAKKPD